MRFSISWRRDLLLCVNIRRKRRGRVLRNCFVDNFRGDENASVIAVEAECEQEEVQVAIVGGGLAGLAVLLALRTRGIQAHLFEKCPNLRSDTATAIGIGPIGVTALEGIKPGLSKIMSELGTYTTLLKVDTTRVQQALAKLVCEDYIHCSHELLFYKHLEDGHVHAYFEVKDVSGSNHLRHFKSVLTQLLIGADGIWSAVRKQMINDEPRYLHMVDWNTVVYDPHQEILEGVGRGEIYLHVDLNRSMNFVLSYAGDYALWILRRSKVRALQQIQGFEGWDALKKAIEATDEKAIFERKIMNRLPLDKWSDADGSVLLIGDAAHAMYVGPGQGARTAFEDAHQLALLLEEVNLGSCFTKENIRTAVSKFEELRIPRMRKMQEYATHSTQQARFEPEWVQKLSPEEAQKRGLEFMQWVEAYPKNQQGDPDSTFFK
ncbi:hypothetical protein GOP47_0021647 [Adiantum capillus-veneris]|uniref:FAD-binding domain-containing protein n=1 Tax=Adiantum capillus-veneris TaxID=13818 RepID=A0A9D4Z6R6_ADICA|nr:hypothetical protein GOP47_0021647 [Adiantum capillus-veneris]